MKKKIVVYLAGLLTVLGLGFGQAQFADVPAGHWAREAVERIAAAGLITGFPDGTFRGDTNLTRYQAALIFHRLLTQLEERPVAIAPEDLVVIRNAVQEVAAELAALGVRVTALEDNAATRDDIARLEAAIEEVKKAIPEPGVDAAALADLADRVEAASVAADTALAQAQALAERLDAVEGNVAALETNVEANADSIRALNELAVLLNQDVLSLQDRVTAVEKRLGEIDFDAFAEREDVSAVQEFATALRADLVRLSDRVSALDTRVTGLDTRLTAVEGNRPTLTGSLLARYGWRTTTGANFDIDRLFPAAGLANNDDAADLAGAADTLVQSDLTFGLRRTPAATTGFNFSEASATFRFTGGAGSLQVPDNVISLRTLSVAGNIDGQPVTLRYHINNTFSLTPNFMNNTADPAGRGALVTFSATRAFLAPTFTVALGSIVHNAASGDGDYFGIRGEFDLLGLRAGLAYGEVNSLVSGNIPSRALVGGTLSGRLLGMFDLTTEAISSNVIATNVPDTLFFTQLGTTLGPIALRGNYRSIDPAFATANWPAGTDAAGLSRNDAGRIFDPANAGTGFGVIGSATLGMFAFNGYFDSREDFATLANPTTAFGVGVGFPLFAGFSATGYFNSLTRNAVATYSVATPYTTMGPATRAAFGNRFGVRLVHDGAAAGALIRDLTLALEYRGASGTRPTNAAGVATTDLVAEATYALRLGFLTLTPNLRYHAFTGANDAAEPNHTTLKYGIQASTTPLFFGVSLTGAFAARTSTFDPAPVAPAANTSETLIRFGISAADFLMRGATLTLGVAQFTGEGVAAFATRAGNTPFDTTVNRLLNGPSVGFGPMAPQAGVGGIRGIQATYTYHGMALWLGVFDFDSDATTFSTIESVGRGFRISYSFSF